MLVSFLLTKIKLFTRSISKYTKYVFQDKSSATTPTPPRAGSSTSPTSPAESSWIGLGRREHSGQSTVSKFFNWVYFWLFISSLFQRRKRADVPVDGLSQFGGSAGRRRGENQGGIAKACSGCDCGGFRLLTICCLQMKCE